MFVQKAGGGGLCRPTAADHRPGLFLSRSVSPSETCRLLERDYGVIRSVSNRNLPSAPCSPQRGTHQASEDEDPSSGSV